MIVFCFIICLVYGSFSVRLRRDTLSYYTMHYVCSIVQKEKDEEFSEGLKLTSRERHFINFASAEYDGQIYMTPQDFLESFVEEEPRRKFFMF